MVKLVVAECERCESRWLIEAVCSAHLMEGICGPCQSESDVAERPLTFREPHSIRELTALWPAIKTGKTPIIIDAEGYPAQHFE